MESTITDYAIARAIALRTNPYPTVDYRVSRTEDDLIDYLSEHDACLFGEVPDIAEDTESLPDDSPYCLTLSHTPATARLIYADNHKLLRFYRDYQNENKLTHRIFHNYLHDTKVVLDLDIPITGKFADTLVMAFEMCLGGGGDDEEEAGMAGRGSLGLKQLAHRHLNMLMTSFPDTVYPHSIPNLHKYLSSITHLIPKADFPKVCICGHQPHKGKCPILNCPPHRAKLLKPPSETDEDSKIRFLRQKINNVLLGNTDKNGDEKDPWKLIKGWHDWDKEFMVELAGEWPKASIGDVPEVELLPYACGDADATLRLYLFLSKMMLPGSPFWLFWS